MASPKQIIGVIAISGLILAGMAWWMSDQSAPAEQLLEGQEQLDGPLTAEEQVTNNPGIMNDANRIATLHTNKGTITIELFESTMPVTTGNFIELAEQGFYDGTKFHRVIEGFMIQGGDPNSQADDPSSYGAGGPGYTIQDEFVSAEHLTNVRGTIAMANTGQPNSGGSQFFINTSDNTGLDFDKEPSTSKHPVFGRVVDGMEVVDAIEQVPTGANDIPVEPVIVESVTIEGAENTGTETGSN